MADFDPFSIFIGKNGKVATPKKDRYRLAYESGRPVYRFTARFSIEHNRGEYYTHKDISYQSVSLDGIRLKFRNIHSKNKPLIVTVWANYSRESMKKDRIVGYMQFFNNTACYGKNPGGVYHPILADGSLGKKNLYP